MADRRSPDRLPTELRALARALDIRPPPADLAASVLDRIGDEPITRPSGRRRLLAAAATGSARGRRIVVAAVVAALLALAAGTPAAARVVEWLGLGGVVVLPAPAAPRAAPVPTPAADPGWTEVGLAAARARVPFPLAVPADLGPPDRVLISADDSADDSAHDSAHDSADDRVVGMLWTPDGERPEVRLDQFAGGTDPVFAKRYDDVEFLTVDGADALWLARRTRWSTSVPRGVRQSEAARTSGPSLVWQRGPVTLRLEGLPDRDRAVAVAESVADRRPATGTARAAAV
jgi:hypothetical protein